MSFPPSAGDILNPHTLSNQRAAFFTRTRTLIVQLVLMMSAVGADCMRDILNTTVFT